MRSSSIDDAAGMSEVDQIRFYSVVRDKLEKRHDWLSSTVRSCMYELTPAVLNSTVIPHAIHISSPDCILFLYRRVGQPPQCKATLAVVKSAELRPAVAPVRSLGAADRARRRGPRHGVVHRARANPALQQPTAEPVIIHAPADRAARPASKIIVEFPTTSIRTIPANNDHAKACAS